MAILGMDLGQKRAGLAISREGLAFEYKTISVSDFDLLIEEIKQICGKEKVEKIVIGLSKTNQRKVGFQAKRQLDFGQKLKNQLNIPIIWQDELLTTKEAVRILKEQKIKKEKVKSQIDSKAAQLILQSYLDKENLY